MKALLTISVLLWLTPPLVGVAQSADDIVGTWLRGDKKNYRVKIYACDDTYCGKIVWLKEPNDDQGNPRRDQQNPDPTKRQNPLLGMDVLTGFKFDGKSWKNGKIYSFNRGKHYDAQIKLKEGELHLNVSILFFTRNYVWIQTE